MENNKEHLVQNLIDILGLEEDQETNPKGKKCLGKELFKLSNTSLEILKWQIEEHSIYMHKYWTEKDIW